MFIFSDLLKGFSLLPLFLIKFLADDSGTPYEKYNAVLTTESINEIDLKIKQILFDKEIRDMLKKGRREFLEDTLEYQGESSQKIIQLMKSMIKKAK